MKTLKVGEHGWGSFYTCMNIDTCQSHFKKGEEGE
jgi:hypothetical protein